MFGIFAGDPQDWLPRLPEPSPWWDGLWQSLRECIKPIVGFAAPGVLGWLAYAAWTDRPLFVGMLVWGLISFFAWYGLFYTVDACRDALDAVRLRGHIRPPQ